MRLHYYEDPGHGWVKTTVKTLESLGLSDKITRFSYREGNTVYLEEDCDAPQLVRALKDKGIEVEWVEHFTNNQSRIRYKQPYYYP